VRSRHVRSGLCLGFLTFSSEVLAGAWTLPAGQGQAVITGTLSSADRIFDSSSAMQPAPRYNKFELQGLLEYGVTDRLTAIATPSLQHVDIAAPHAARSGLGYADLGARYQLLSGDSWVLSGQTTLRVPGTFDNGHPAAVGYTDTEVDVRGLVGYSFAVGPWPTFVDLQLAQRFRLGDIPNEFRADFTFGLRLLPHWLLLVQSFNVISEGAGGPLFPSYDYQKFQLSVVYDLTTALSLQVGGFTTYAGRNALQENGVIAGMWYRF